MVELSGPTASAQSNRGRRNRRRGAGRPKPPPSQTQEPTSTPRAAGARAFGGQLTRVHADAPAFVPASIAPVSGAPAAAPVAAPSPPSGPPQGRPSKRRPSQTSSNFRSRRESLSRSTAPDIATRIQDDIAHGVYECAICTNEIARHSKIWSCRTCWTVFHIGCIKRWSKNEGSAVSRAAGPDAATEDDTPVGKQWRCPGCNLPKDVSPSAYTCWCEKELDPKPITGLPPHSCGQTCGRERAFPKHCPHPCHLLCHAGPCPPCAAMGPRQSCFCGKQETTQRCLDTNYDSGWSCSAVCSDMMPCGEHTCPRPCHEGLCGACTTKVPATCYCGKVDKEIVCNERRAEMASSHGTGVFDCHQVCDTAMDCGLHKCEKTCHPRHARAPHCPRSVDVITHCPCGQSTLAELDAPARQSCVDPIPTCHKPCGKELPCGHCCKQTCHTGKCGPCGRSLPRSCHCGRNSFDIICHAATDDPPLCTRLCKATLNCGRHECGERCCSGERKAAERQATKRKLKPLGATPRMLDDNIEAEHICTRECGRRLKCGNHDCTDLCHRGPCGSCKEAIFEDISCSCGRTTLQAPLPCGTQPPPCHFPCTRPKACGHPTVAHNCHAADEECPKCPFLTEKPCLCGKKTLKNQPCWRADVLCGLVCGKLLKCGSHRCQKTCHRAGACEDAHQHCQQPCGKEKRTCGHPCELACHAPAICREEKPCPFKVMITCDCQRKKEEVKCNAKAHVPEPPGRQNSLKCDDECARLERNRKLALALHISDDHTDDHVPYSTTTLQLYLEDVVWAHKQEDALRLFAADDAEKRYRFPPMKPRQRAFLHSLAEDFGFDGESLDPEPHRHVVLFKTPKFVAAPMKTLAQAARIKRTQLQVAAPAPAMVPVTVEKKVDHVPHHYNGLLLTGTKFALTEDELRPAMHRASPTTDLNTVFLTHDAGVAVLPRGAWDAPEQLTTLLTTLQPTITTEVTKHHLATSVVLCEFETVGRDVRILQRRPPSEPAVAHGWSTVAAKRAAPMQAPQVKPVGERPVFTVLGSRLAEAKKMKTAATVAARLKAKAPEVVDDWEAEMDRVEHDEAQTRDGNITTTDHDEAQAKSLDVTTAEPDAGDRGVAP